MAATPSLTGSPQPAGIDVLPATPVGSVPAPKVQPLWRFALVGLGPLTALAVFGLLFAFFQRLA